MNLDDFPFDDLLKGKKKEEWTILIKRVHAFLLKEVKKEWDKIENSSISDLDKDTQHLNAACGDISKLLTIMRMYTNMKCIKGDIDKLSIHGDTVYWSVGIQNHALFFKRHG